ncbi:hypothetical protein M6D93_00205 [Jatrophihabitans telluris]|uniref:Bacteriocin n=1 Tax=Jatrophihabitans telluris TaxID=2038343 RepID=A0ABY4QYS7_9ACTN|nr:hypothetical protein [Jatrophihabitans telluris]UQX88442.1 hypothetical protein M6D93_00205 [Jatrophihabitans telluris]
MNIDKDQILQLLKSQGKHDEAAQAGNELPQSVDTDNSEHQNLLSRFGIDTNDLPGVIGGLGKLL